MIATEGQKTQGAIVRYQGSGLTGDGAGFRSDMRFPSGRCEGCANSLVNVSRLPEKERCMCHDWVSVRRRTAHGPHRPRSVPPSPHRRAAIRPKTAARR
ncbi:hypothetical protein GCM10010417_14720 [Streptomyces carpaticus]